MMSGLVPRLLGRMATRRTEVNHPSGSSETRLDALFAASPAVTYTCEPQSPFRVTCVAKNTTDQLGYRPDEWLQDPRFWIDHVHSEDAPHILADRPHVIERGHHAQEYRFRNRDGRYRWLLDDLRIVQLSSGAPAEIVGAWIDITDRKLREEHLRHSEARYRDLFEHHLTSAYVSTPSGEMLDCNQAFVRVFGFSSKEEALHASAAALYWTPDEREAVVERVRRERVLNRRECRLRRRDGTALHVVQNVIGTFARDGELTELTKYVVDVAEQRQADHALRARETYLRTVISHLPIVLWVIDQEGRFTLSDGKGLRALGLAPGELVGRSAFEVYQHSPEIVDNNRRALRGESFGSEVSLGELRYQVWQSPLRDEAGAVTGAIGVAVDVTERRHLEQQLRQTQKIEAVGRLAGGIAHDFNNLLTAIGGYTYLVLQTLDETDRRWSDLLEVHKAAQRAAGLTRQLLAFSRRQILQPRVFDVNALIADLEKLLRRTIPENIELVLKLTPDLEPVRADIGQIEQVVLNLAVNASDAMPHGGHLRLVTENAEVDEIQAHRYPPMTAGRYVRLTVIDTGTGMTPETQARIFEPFFTTKERGKGTGLGLATVYGIVKQSGGFVWVTSHLGRGTTFEVYLPAVQEPLDPTVQVELSEEITGGSEIILLAEDDGAVRRLARDVLTTYGYTVLAARDGDEALVMAREHPGQIDLLVTDVVMPGLSGRELAAHLLSERPDVRVLYASGYAEDITTRAGLEHGVPFLTKPFLPTELVRKVREVLGMARQPNH